MAKKKTVKKTTKKTEKPSKEVIDSLANELANEAQDMVFNDETIAEIHKREKKERKVYTYAAPVEDETVLDTTNNQDVVTTETTEEVNNDLVTDPVTTVTEEELAATEEVIPINVTGTFQSTSTTEEIIEPNTEDGTYQASSTSDMVLEPNTVWIDNSKKEPIEEAYIPTVSIKDENETTGYISTSKYISTAVSDDPYHPSTITQAITMEQPQTKKEEEAPVKPEKKKRTLAYKFLGMLYD